MGETPTTKAKILNLSLLLLVIVACDAKQKGGGRGSKPPKSKEKSSSIRRVATATVQTFAPSFAPSGAPSGIGNGLGGYGNGSGGSGGGGSGGGDGKGFIPSDADDEDVNDGHHNGVESSDEGGGNHTFAQFFNLNDTNRDLAHGHHYSSGTHYNAETRTLESDHLSQDDEENEDETTFEEFLNNHDHSTWQHYLLSQCAGRRSDEMREKLRSCVNWGVGIEHETMLVHRREDSLEEYVVNVGKVARDMARYGRIHGLDRHEHCLAISLASDAELSGRTCAGVKDINFRAMAESISIDHSELTFDAAFCQIQMLDQKHVDIINHNPFIKKLSGDIGPVTLPRTGMSSELGMYTRTQGKTFMCASCGSCDLKDYTGSYHISLSLPTDSEGWILSSEDVLKDRDTCADTQPSHRSLLRGERGLFSTTTKQDKWISAHANFANMVQWIEPILLASYGIADSHAVCDDNTYVEGSYRTMGVGWGVPGTTDVRTFKSHGTGRYSNQGFDWLFEMDTPYRESLSGCIGSGMGADIRTKSSVDEHTLGEGEHPPKMEVGQGIEIRIFDNIPVEHLPDIYRMIVLLAEASRLHDAPNYVYDDSDWKTAMQESMREGWNGILPAAYVSKLEEALNLDLSGLNGVTQAFEVFYAVYDGLLKAHREGLWTSLLLDDIPEKMPDLNNMNRESWELGAINAGISPGQLMEMFPVNGDSVHTVLSSLATEGSCGDDIEDLIYLADSFGMVHEMTFNPDGSIYSFLLSEDAASASQKDFILPTCRTDFEFGILVS